MCPFSNCASIAVSQRRKLSRASPGLFIWREIQHEARTDGGKPRPFELFCQGKIGSRLLLLLPPRLTTLRMRFRPRGIDMVVHVDANGPGHDLRNARITPSPPHSAMPARAASRRRHPLRSSGILAAKDWDNPFSTYRS